MTDEVLGNYHYLDLAFDKDGQLTDPAQPERIRTLADSVSDLIVISHGWNNSADQARGLYARIAASFDQVRAAGHEPGLAERTLGIVGIIWPSKQFSDSDLVPPNAASLDGPDPALRQDLLAARDSFRRPGAQAALTEAAALSSQLADSETAQRRYVALLRSVVAPDDKESPDPSGAFFHLDGVELLRRLDLLGLLDAPATGPSGTGGVAAEPLRAVGDRTGTATGNGTGGAAGLGDLVHSAWSSGRALLNYTTFYEMKARAGQLGATALAPVLTDQVIGRTRLHLVGHSFGARLVTAAGSQLQATGCLRSVSLLQGAFSHYALAHDWQPGSDGAYRRLVTGGQLAGPLVVTHTRNDTAVGIAYALASRIADETASAIGDATDKFGGLGSNGALATPEVRSNNSVLLDVDGEYDFSATAVNNLLADAYISGHSDVSGPQVAHAILRAVAAAT